MTTKTPSSRSVFGLDWMIFFMSDVRPGVGPFLAIYLRSFLNWGSDLVGIALGTIDLTAAICQIPCGIMVDSVKYKRFLIATACLIIAFACLILLYFPTFKLVIFAQSLIGVSVAIIPPAIAAITLGLFKRKLFPKRVSINETWVHAGNVVTASFVGFMGYWLGLPWVIIMVIVFASFCIFFLTFINPKEIDHDAARELTNVDDKKSKPIGLSKYLLSSSILIFCCSVFLFHFSNGAQLPLLGQLISQRDPSTSSLFMGACIVLSQFVMIGVAYTVGNLLKDFGRKPIFLTAFAVLPIRALLYTLTDNEFLLLSIQVLDGICAGIFGVIGVVMISDIAKGTGRFNFSIGLMALSQGLGSSSSNVVSGLIVERFGFNPGFITLACIAIIGFCFFGFLMPETKQE